MKILDRINSSNDVKKLKVDELEPLCSEIREFIIDNVSKTGGHLASNLGTVELTVALHRVYDTSKDRIVFDVGHQSYTHKIITGRRDEFSTLRCHGGLSGFPKPYEAVDDAFIAGHASNSVSVALGMARARTMTKGDYDVAAVIGDGALTGGLAYEGFINVGGSNEPMVVILNDNGMSINSNVGGIAKLLSKERLSPAYFNFKRRYRALLENRPKIYSTNHKIKEAIKKHVLPANMFDSIGLYYLGPVDGHDINQLETVIRWARDLRVPALVHVITRKGNGCKYAEEHPDKYHGVGKFDPVTGELPESKPSFSSVFGNRLSEIGYENRKVVAISAAMCSGTGLNRFAENHADRFFDVGIAEQHAVAMAAGMAKQGLIPVVALYSSFLQRAYDMLIHDISLQNLHVVLCVDRAGLVGSDGETHHGAFDISYLSSVPGMQILCPSSFAELETMLTRAIYDFDGPVAIRYPRGGEGVYKDNFEEKNVLLRSGDDITVVAYGPMLNTAIELCDKLSAENVSAELIKLGQIKPLDCGELFKSLQKTGKLIIAEDVCDNSCVGNQILTLAQIEGVEIKAAAICNLGDGLVSHGTVDELMCDCGLDADSLTKKALTLVRGAK